MTTLNEVKRYAPAGQSDINTILHYAYHDHIDKLPDWHHIAGSSKEWMSYPIDLPSLSIGISREPKAGGGYIYDVQANDAPELIRAAFPYSDQQVRDFAARAQGIVRDFKEKHDGIGNPIAASNLHEMLMQIDTGMRDMKALEKDKLDPSARAMAGHFTRNDMTTHAARLVSEGAEPTEAGSKGDAVRRAAIAKAGSVSAVG